MRAATPVVLVLLGLAGCASMQPPALPSTEPLAMPALAQPLARARAGGLFVAERSPSLTSDTRAFRPGDVLTVTLQETTQASKQANTQLGKESSADLSAALRDKSLTGSLASKRDFTGSATSTQQNALSGAITVVVHEVMPNGLLKVQGEKSLYLNQGEELIRLGGYVRPSDVDSENRVSSQRIANARISYSGQGDLASANTPGWLTRWFVSAMAPF